MFETGGIVGAPGRGPRQNWPAPVPAEGGKGYDQGSFGQGFPTNQPAPVPSQQQPSQGSFGGGAGFTPASAENFGGYSSYSPADQQSAMARSHAAGRGGFLLPEDFPARQQAQAQPAPAQPDARQGLMDRFRDARQHGGWGNPFGGVSMGGFGGGMWGGPRGNYGGGTGNYGWQGGTTGLYTGMQQPQQPGAMAAQQLYAGMGQQPQPLDAGWAQALQSRMGR